MSEEFYTADMSHLNCQDSAASWVPDQIRVKTPNPTEGWDIAKFKSDPEKVFVLDRVRYQGNWFTFVDYVDGEAILNKIPKEVLDAEQAASKAEYQKEVQAKGHDCWDFVQHDFDPDSRLGDYYFCSQCNEILQVG